MLCACKKEAVIEGLCEDHLCETIEKNVEELIAEYGLCTFQDKICVAASGGKDSLTVLHILSTLGYAVEALAIDEGIPDYREHTLADLKTFCESRNIPLNVVRFEDIYGEPLGKPAHPCSVCGVKRRDLLNRFAQGYDVLATGHNLDDEAQAVLMNLAKAHISLLNRMRPRSIKTKGFVPRIKPLARIPERWVAAYALIKGFSVRFAECPHAGDSYRGKVRDVLNDYDLHTPGTKQALLNAAWSRTRTRGDT